MPAVARVIPWLVLAFSLPGLALGVYEWQHPPFSDQQLEASLVDTWEVATSTTRVFAIVFLGLGAISLVLARKAPAGGARTVGYLAAACCLLTVALFLRNHVELTLRVTDLTGREFGPLFGLL